MDTNSIYESGPVPPQYPPIQNGANNGIGGYPHSSLQGGGGGGGGGNVYPPTDTEYPYPDNNNINAYPQFPTTPQPAYPDPNEYTANPYNPDYAGNPNSNTQIYAVRVNQTNPQGPYGPDVSLPFCGLLLMSFHCINSRA